MKKKKEKSKEGEEMELSSLDVYHLPGVWSSCETGKRARREFLNSEPGPSAYIGPDPMVCMQMGL